MFQELSSQTRFELVTMLVMLLYAVGTLWRERSRRLAGLALNAWARGTITAFAPPSWLFARPLQVRVQLHVSKRSVWLCVDADAANEMVVSAFHVIADVDDRHNGSLGLAASERLRTMQSQLSFWTDSDKLQAHWVKTLNVAKAPNVRKSVLVNVLKALMLRHVAFVHARATYNVLNTAQEIRDLLSTQVPVWETVVELRSSPQRNYVRSIHQ